MINFQLELFSGMFAKAKDARDLHLKKFGKNLKMIKLRANQSDNFCSFSIHGSFYWVKQNPGIESWRVASLIYG